MKAKNVKKHISDKSHFADPLKIKNQIQPCEPENGVNSPWDFRCPQYDQRSSNFINAGTHYGVGVNQPVGHKGNPKQFVDAMPMKRHSTMESDEKG